jgi:microcystin-dependent protein
MKKILMVSSLLIFANVFCHAVTQKYKITTSTKAADVGYSIKGSQKYEICADTASAPVVTISSYTVNLGGIQTGNEQGVKVGSATVADVANSVSAANISAGSLGAGVIASSVAVNSVYPASIQEGNYSLPTSSMTVYYLYVSSLVANGFTAGGGTGGFDSMPVGSWVGWHSTSTIPSDFILGEGQAVSRTDYAALFAVYGTKFGAGDGSTTFNVPDFRGVVQRGLDNGRGFDSEANRVIGSTQTDTLQGHFHDFAPNLNDGSVNGFTISSNNKAQDNVTFNNYGTVRQPITDGTNGTPRTSSETRMKNIAVAYIIKYRVSTSTSMAVYDSTGTWTAKQNMSEVETSYGFYHDRGDPEPTAWDKSSWTTNGTWVDWDLSAIAPVGTKSVRIRLSIKDDAPDSEIVFRKNGNTNIYAIEGAVTQVANQAIPAYITVPCDANRVIEYNATNTTWTSIYAVILGWSK